MSTEQRRRLATRKRVATVTIILAAVALVVIGGRVAADQFSAPTGLAVFDVPPEPTDSPEPVPGFALMDTRYLTEVAGWRFYAAHDSQDRVSAS